MGASPVKRPNPIDKHVGSRVRMRRLMLGMSQTKLGDAVDITFQQVQKYEKGTNRISASRMQQFAKILNVPISFFFENVPGARVASYQSSDKYSTVVAINQFTASRDGLAIMRAFSSIADDALRRAVVGLVKELADGAGRRGR